MLAAAYNHRNTNTYCRVQCDDGKNYNEYQIHNDEEGVEPAVMIRWREKVEENSR